MTDKGVSSIILSLAQKNWHNQQKAIADFTYLDKKMNVVNTCIGPIDTCFLTDAMRQEYKSCISVIVLVLRDP